MLCHFAGVLQLLRRTGVQKQKTLKISEISLMEIETLTQRLEEPKIDDLSETGRNLLGLLNPTIIGSKHYS
ncbi:protein of unknown function [Legionella fallonii LLAP-10]|uniref:Uncharacterized protein n=1 Tax=Legionella fallonii LLAP-10 TaxID=1212491 RepID=A0A098G8N4_9GAMM|nr:protein of unknown function [Legionella fallonii LLAP-10]